jgi:hypothetical protein
VSDSGSSSATRPSSWVPDSGWVPVATRTGTAGLPVMSCAGPLVGGLADVLTEGGTAQLLANWVITDQQDWEPGIAGWIPQGCDAWVWQRETADPGEYVSLWFRDSGERPGTPRWVASYELWRNWFEQTGVLGIGTGLINVRRTGSGSAVIVCEDVPQAVEQPVAPAIRAWFDRAEWMRSRPCAGLLAARLRVAPDLIRDRRELITPDGWEVSYQQLRQAGGMRWEVEVDDLAAGLVAACDGTIPLHAIVSVVASLGGIPERDVSAAVISVVTDLVRRGMLLPASA